MQNETVSAAFKEYGSVYKKMIEDKKNSMICQTMHIPAQRFLSQFLHFSCEAYLEVESGTGILLVSHDPEKKTIDEFGMNQRVVVKPGVYFAFVATTPELIVNIFVNSDYSLDTLNISTPYEFHPVLPRIQIKDILGYYYRIRTPGYQFKGEKHQFFELTYVDTGILHTEVDGVQYTLSEKDGNAAQLLAQVEAHPQDFCLTTCLELPSSILFDGVLSIGDSLTKRELNCLVYC